VAEKVLITMLDDEAPGFNLSHWVGTGAINLKGDVLLLQAMITFIVEGHEDFSMVGITSDADLPDLSGRLDHLTLSAIMNYKHRWMRRLWFEPNDTVMHVDYTRYKFTEADSSRPTITMLHQHCMDAASRLNEADYTVAMPNLFPELRPFI
jgi:hypothetical protein